MNTYKVKGFSEKNVKIFPAQFNQFAPTAEAASGLSQYGGNNR